MCEKKNGVESRTVRVQDGAQGSAHVNASGRVRLVNESFRNYSEVDRDPPPPPPRQ